MITFSAKCDLSLMELWVSGQCLDKRHVSTRNFKGIINIFYFDFTFYLSLHLFSIFLFNET